MFMRLIKSSMVYNSKGGTMEIHYFSGTGNTKILAENLSLGLECPLRGLDEIQSSEFVLMYPVHGFGPPKNVLDWVKGLPGKNANVYIIKTAGDCLKLNHQAGHKMIKILESKGYQVLYDRLIVMPSNIFIKFPLAISAQLYDVALHKIALCIEDIKNKKERCVKKNIISSIFASSMHYLESRFGARYFGRSLRVNENCTKCGICVKECPSGNIQLNDQISFQNHCIFCMKCIYNCKVHAIYSKSLNFVVLDSYHVDEFTKHPERKGVLKGYYKHYIKYMEDDLL